MEKVSYKKANKSIQIADNFSRQAWLTNTIIILNLIMACQRLVYWNEQAIWHWIAYVWLFVALLSVAALLFFAFKVSTQREISLDKIKHLQVRKILGRSRLSLRLHNGRQRHITHLKNSSEAEILKDFLTGLGVTINE